MPVPTGSPAVAKTIGITDVACLAASGGRVLCVTITSTLSRTNSAAISANRSLRPSAQRYSIVRLRPSLQPNSRNRWTKAAVHSLCAAAVPEPSKPMSVGLLRCARAASGQAAAPPSSLMKSRRFTRSARRRGRAAWAEPPSRVSWQSSFSRCGRISTMEATTLDSPYSRMVVLTLNSRSAISFHADAGSLDYLAHLFGFVGQELAEVLGRHRQRKAAEVVKPCLHLGIGEGGVHLLV